MKIGALSYPARSLQNGGGVIGHHQPGGANILAPSSDSLLDYGYGDFVR